MSDRTALRQAAKAHYESLMKGEGVDNPDLGRVTFSGRGKGKTLTGSSEKLQAVARLQDIVSQGRRNGSPVQDTKGRKSVKAFHPMVAEITVAGKRYRAEFTVREDVNGKFHYDLEVREGGAAQVEPVFDQTVRRSDLEQTPPQNIGPDGDNINLRLTPADADGPRGRITFGRDGTAIQLFEGADASTMIHESAHWFVETLTRIADDGAPEALTDDLNTLRRFAGLSDGAGWTVDAHEAVARAFEAYMREGRAPDPALNGVFARIRDWLVQLYRNIRDLDVGLTDEVRGVSTACWRRKTGSPIYRRTCAERSRRADVNLGLVQARGHGLRRAAECVLQAV